MIGDHPIGSINPILVFIPKFALIRTDTTQFLDFLEDWAEYISVIIWSFVLNDRDQPLETHPSVDVSHRKWFQWSIVFPIELNENIVPYFEYIGVILIDQMSCVPPPYAIVVYLTEWAWVLNGIEGSNGNFTCLQGPHGPVAPISDLEWMLACSRKHNDPTYPKSYPWHFQVWCDPLERPVLTRCPWPLNLAQGYSLGLPRKR